MDLVLCLFFSYKLVDGTRFTESPAPASAAADKCRILGWFRKTLPDDFFAQLKRDFEITANSCIYTLPVTVWLMIVQRLSPGGTLAEAVSELKFGHGRELLEPCKRVREDKISSGTASFSDARQRVPAEAARRIAEHTFAELLRVNSGDTLQDQLYLLDGSSVDTAHSSANARAYPPCHNQYGESHWPVLRVAVMHHVTTAMAMALQFGPMFGSQAVSEQALATPLIDALPEPAVLIADRNFGVFSVVWQATRRRHRVIVRLTEQRAQLLNGGELQVGQDRKLTWRPSRHDLATHPDLNGEEEIAGRLVVARAADPKQILYLFTTLAQETPDAVTQLYRLRWNIETDLRSLKEQVRLHSIQAQSPQMVACELLMGIAAYNLIRAVMAEAARQAGIEPRRLSFSRCRTIFWAFSRAAATALSEAEFDRYWNLLMEGILQSKLPQRTRPTAPRAVWKKRLRFPNRR
jgi:hypothetical protein